VLGKSTIFETYTKLCSNYHPDVLPIYVTLDDLNVKGNEMEDQTILEYVHTCKVNF
jgi:hypothetical protein